jgi:hypothetical protein
MNVGNSVRKAVAEWESAELESAMLHACNAVDGTAKKVHPHLGNRDRFTRLLRENYAILGPMGVPGINVEETRFASSGVPPDQWPDLADIVYKIHRCAHGHGDELPSGYELIPDVGTDVPNQLLRTRYEPGLDRVRLSDRIIFGLVAVAVFSPVNVGQRVPDSYALTYGPPHTEMVINEWWGRASDFQAIVASSAYTPRIKFDFSPLARP